MLSAYTLYPIFGLPLIAYGGILTLISLLITASIGYMNVKGITQIPFQWHFRSAKTTIVLALLHGIFAFLTFWR